MRTDLAARPGQVIGLRRDGRLIRLLAGGSGPALVQVKSATATTSPVTVTLTSATTQHNCLVAAIGEGNSTTNPAVSGITLGGGADNWAFAVANKNNAQANGELWVDEDCAGGQTAVEVSFTPGTGAGNGYTVYVFEFAGPLTVSVVDAMSSGGAGSGAWSSGLSGTLAIPSEIAVGVGVGIGSAGAPTLAGPASPWTNETALSAARTAMIAGYQILSSTSSVTYSGTSSTGRVGAAIITLKAPTIDTVSDSDTGAGADAGTVAATLSSAETGAGADTATISAASADTGAGADAGSLTAAVPGADTAAGAEAATVAVSDSDTGSGGDAGSATLGATDTETGSAAESGAITGAGVTSGDTGTGAETTAISATAASGDAGSGTEAAKVGVTSGDTGGAVSEQATQAPYIRPPVVLWNAPDKLSTRGGTMR